MQDGFTRFERAYPICNKEVGTVARVLINEHFSVFGLLIRFTLIMDVNLSISYG